MDVRCELWEEKRRRDRCLLSACTTRPVVPSSLHLCGSAGVSVGVCGGPTGSMIVELSGSICCWCREAQVSAARVGNTGYVYTSPGGARRMSDKAGKCTVPEIC